MTETAVRYLAFHMSGFGGLFVPERVIHFATGVVITAAINGFHVRIVSVGDVFDSRDECLDECDRRNVGNPFWKRPFVVEVKS